MIAMIIKDFGARPARAGWPHTPEIIICRNADDPVVGQASRFFPNLGRFVVIMVNGDAQPVFVDAKLFGDQFPGKRNCIGFEIIAKAKVSEHLEKCMVARGVSHIIQIIMLTASAHTFLRRCRPLVIACFHPGKQVFKLHHPRIYEHQGRIILGHQRAGFNNLMSLLCEIIQKGRTDIV